MAIWDDVIPAAELSTYATGGMGETMVGFGKNPALLIIDMANAFANSKYLLGKSETAGPCIKAIKRVLDSCRAKGVPVIYTTARWSDNAVERGLWKRTPAVEQALALPEAYDIVDELKPMPTEPVIVKAYPSGFFGTALASMLTQLGVDTTIVTGMVTSGCVYATAVDSFSNGYRTIIPEECVADRSNITHKVSLFNFHMKYGDVVTTDQVLAYLNGWRRPV
ncbi:isochorismatase family protein [Moorella sp. Hama-1]|uniref:isochorismatase family protein n=1 Tax=Moorella sp. Hama-1 TaxID=2138101 RepID=UPI000D659955|nr:isochorismatase family protein [Moorella sp. Hama-1]BCV21312.1 hydrolase [Moorella sp. Hama-1]